MARLLRWRVLTLDASVIVLPANPPAADAAITTRRRGAATRGRLSEAVKTIGQAEHELARARQVNHVALPESRLLS